MIDHTQMEGGGRRVWSTNKSTALSRATSLYPYSASSTSISPCLSMTGVPTRISHSLSVLDILHKIGLIDRVLVHHDNSRRGGVPPHTHAHTDAQTHPHMAAVQIPLNSRCFLLLGDFDCGFVWHPPSIITSSLLQMAGGQSKNGDRWGMCGLHQ